MIERIRHVWLALSSVPGLLFDRKRRTLFGEMRAFAQVLPGLLKGPLPAALEPLTPAAAGTHQAEHIVRNLADLTALLDRRSPLGLCLRRSLMRYHFLRRSGVPVVVHFGAKFVNGQADRDITGHAWLTLDGLPYFESGENWRGFTVMLSYPALPPSN